VSAFAAGTAAGSRRGLWTVLIAVWLLAAVSVEAAGAATAISRDDPETLVRQATSQLLEVSRAAKAYASEDPERYYRAVDGVLDQVLDIHYFARGVMATYASKRAYDALPTESEKQAFRDRIERFVEAIKRVFMVKYSDALLTFAGERIDVARLPTDADQPDHASVQQTIYDDNGKHYVVQYSLHRVKDGGWMIYNVIVEAVNLGQTYRSQFAEAVEAHHGDVDYVVAHWVDLMLAHDSEQTPPAPDGRP
jgi:phospholipid transport system substrate-binding protein